MKQAYSGILFLLAIVPALPQDQRPANVCRIETRYDRFADTTTTQCNLIELGEGAPRLIVQANTSFRGKESNETAIFWRGLSSYRGGATRRTQPSFKEAATVRLLVDSARLEIPVKDYGSDFFELNRLLAERARAEISREDFQKLLEARSLEGKWGDVEFKFSDAALQTARRAQCLCSRAAQNGREL
jgi:hypothetical protein